ncbi:MAG: DinB family protein [Chitinophagaceae bacterium]|nr:DinB family protein [Chitinophagaceae bacterium]MBK9568990.1 DinB family protein [Chitinophagaceae bacterium]MBL0273110.1 DinB family protein [Chitinophagaceae bacterium]
MARPELSRVPEYFHRYINQVAEDDLLLVLEKQASSFLTFLENIPADKKDYRYAEGKWSLKELLQHIIDTERIFAYRALCIARKELAPLPGFDENSYADNSKADKRDWKELLEEFKIVRRSTQILFGSFDQEQSEASGIASGKPIYVLGIGFILAGHVNHHLTVIKERYL